MCFDIHSVKSGWLICYKAFWFPAYEVRNVIANALIRDRMPYTLVQIRMLEEHYLLVSLGYLHQCFVWAHEQIDMESHWAFVLANFSGVLCIDEVHDSGRTILFATDPLNNFTVFFNIVDKNDQDHMNAFLQSLKDRGVEVSVAITDGSPLYKDALQSYWRGVEHQLCIFHVIKELNKLILDGVRAIKNGVRRQGNKGRKKRRGRPSKQAQQQRERRRGMTKKEQATFIWEHQYLIVRKQEELSELKLTWLSCERWLLSWNFFVDLTSSFIGSLKKTSRSNVHATVEHAWSTMPRTKRTPFWPKR